MRDNGSLVCFETGQVTAYALDSVQQRGRLFVNPGDAVRRGGRAGLGRGLPGSCMGPRGGELLGVRELGCPLDGPGHCFEVGGDISRLWHVLL